jgi:hypothetical protein
VVRTVSRANEVDRLIADLQSPDPVRRDASVARLRVVGARALPRLAKIIAAPHSGSARAHALSALDGVENPRVVDIALEALAIADTETVIAALGVLRGWVAREKGTRLLEAITAIAVDRGRDTRIRVAAIDALSDLPDHLVQPIRDQGPRPEAGGPPVDNPVAARAWLEAHGAQATLATLHDAINRFRDAERRAETSREREEWVKARGAAHGILADRGSRLALYDLRDSFSTALAPLPLGFLDAIGRVGDASCLEPLARAWSASQDEHWRDQLSDAARQILVRSKLGSRNAVVKAVRASWAGFI